MQSPEDYVKKMLRSAPDDFGANYDPTRKTKQIWKLEKMEQQSQSQSGSNSASFFLYRRAKFIDQDRLDILEKQEEEEKMDIERRQKKDAYKAALDKQLSRNQIKRQKKKERKEKFTKKQNGELIDAPKKIIVRDESAIKAVASTINSMKESIETPALDDINSTPL